MVVREAPIDGSRRARQWVGVTLSQWALYQQKRHFRKIPSFSAQMLSNVRILCEFQRIFEKNTRFLRKIRTLPPFCAVIRTFL